MKTVVQLFLLLVISTLVTGYRLPELNDPRSAMYDPGSAMYDPGSAMYDSDYPVDQEMDIDEYGSDRLANTMYDLDLPFDEELENDPGSA